MGLILGPLVIFWLAITMFVLNIGYVLLDDLTSYSDIALVCLMAILCFVSYVYWGFARFKRCDELAWYDIPLFFTANKLSLIAFVSALGVHWLGVNQWMNEFLPFLPVIIMFTLSFGALFGTFWASRFMKYRGIQQIH